MACTEAIVVLAMVVAQLLLVLLKVSVTAAVPPINSRLTIIAAVGREEMIFSLYSLEIL